MENAKWMPQPRRASPTARPHTNGTDYMEKFYELEWATHLHTEIEMVCMRRGKCDAYIDGSRYELSEGDCLIIFPNRIHDYRNGRNDLADVLIVSPGAVSEYNGIFSKKLPIFPMRMSSRASMSIRFAEGIAQQL